MDVKEVPPFPNPGVRLIKEDEHIAIWEELFEPDKSTEPHRHMRDYIQAGFGAMPDEKMRQRMAALIES